MSGIVHFCFGMTPDFGGRPFSFCHYLAIRSAWERLQPELMVLHYVHLPSGPWWELARPMLALHPLPELSGIYGFPASHPAHRADIVRLVALLVMGGLYLDTDVLVLQSFARLGDPAFAAALEVTAAGELIGLSNAIMLAQPSSRFAQLCLEGHDPRRSLWQGFRSRGRDLHYVEMSVRYPALLASLCPGLVEVLPTATFLPIDWRPASLAALFEGMVSLPEQALAVHLWESHAWDPYLSRITPDWVRRTESRLALLARPLLPDVSGRPLPCQPPVLPEPARETMQALLSQVNRVDPEHRPGLSGRLQRRMRSGARRCRDWLLAGKHTAATDSRSLASWDHLPPAPESGEAESSHPCWARCGPADGSWELLQPQLPDHSFAALLLSGSQGEPSLFAALCRQPRCSFLWVTDSLSRAGQLAPWLQQQGCDGRAIHHPFGDALLVERLVAQQFTAVPFLLAIGPTQDLPLLLEGWRRSGVRPPLLLITVRPDSSPAQLWLHPALAEPGFGPPAAVVQPALEALSYQELSRSGDGQFLLFQQPSLATDRPGASPGRLLPPLRLRSLYGDAVTL